MVNVPLTVIKGVPLIVQPAGVLVTVSPAGNPFREPTGALEALQPYGGVPPVTAIAVVYGWPATAFGKTAAVTVSEVTGVTLNPPGSPCEPEAHPDNTTSAGSSTVRASAQATAERLRPTGPEGELRPKNLGLNGDIRGVSWTGCADLSGVDGGDQPRRCTNTPSHCR
jgi:hypothetical protein